MAGLESTENGPDPRKETGEDSQPILFARGIFDVLPTSVGEARRWTEKHITRFASGNPIRESIPAEITLPDELRLARGIWPQRADDIILIASELTTNVLRYAPDTPKIVVELGVVQQPPERKGYLYLGVSDTRPGFGPILPSTPTSTKRRGLELLLKLTAHLDITPITSGGKFVGKTVYGEFGPAKRTA